VGTYTEREAGAYTIIEWTGDMDFSCTPDAREQVLARLGDGRHLLIDLAAVRHIDSSGVAVLIEGHTTARRTGLEFGLLAPSRQVLDVLRLARVDEILPIHASMEGPLSR
jgi:anti-sigma B factor antagonist